MGSDDRRKAQDDFWDISKLVPPRRTGLGRFSQGPALHAVSDPTPPKKEAEKEAEKERRLTVSAPAAGGERVLTYTPAENPLLRSVTVRTRAGGYSFYEQFRRDANRFFDLVGECAPYVPFFSFAPQYSQLSAEQRAYYFYLRTEVRAGRYPQADKGYFFLLVYEVITVTDRIPPKEGARLLAALWEAYRSSLSGIDRYMIAWLTDYCLLHAVPCPPLGAACLGAAADGEFSEFFFGDAAEATEEGILRLLRLSSAYSFEDSRAVTEKSRALIVRHITGAMARVFPYLFGAGMIGCAEAPTVLRRRAFAGSLCAHNAQTDLEVTYVSLCRAEGLRRTVGLAVKYAENRLRAALGIRARLATAGLPAAIAEVIDRYFSAISAELSPRKAAPPPPAYERLYDAPAGALDLAAAAKIEETSWELTRRLVVEEDEAMPSPLPVAVPPEEMPSRVVCPTPPGEGEDAVALLVEAYLAGGDAPLAIARRLGLVEAMAAERVNEEMLEALGDVLLEPSDGGFALIEDYREDAEEWLMQRKK